MLRLRGHTLDQVVSLISAHRAQAQLVDAYLAGVERWLAAGSPPIGPPRIR